MRNLESILIYIIKYFYVFYVLWAITRMFSMPDLYSLLTVTIVIVGLMSMMKIRWQVLDYIVLAGMLYSLISYSFSDYSITLYYYGVKNQLCMMFFYYIARSQPFKSDQFIDNFKWPMIIVMVAGILLYFFPPSWYNSFRYTPVMAEESTHSFYELTRMSSFFTHPYFLGYGSCFFIIYIVKRILINKEENVLNYIFLFVSIFTLFFAQLRTSIAYAVLFVFILSVYISFFSRRKSNFVKFSIFLIPLIVCLYLIVSKIANTDFLEYVEERTIDSNNNLVEDRFNQFSYYTRYLSIVGNGLGRFGHAAVEITHRSIADNEYMRVVCELGYIGAFLIIFPMVYSIIIGMKHVKCCFFETFVVLFYPFAMLGATPLEVSSQHVFLLWFSVGHIVSKVNSQEILSIIRTKLLQS